MPKNHVIKFHVTKDQKQIIEMNAQAGGYTTVSGYLRALALNHNAHFIRRFNKLYRKVMGDNYEE